MFEFWTGSADLAIHGFIIRSFIIYLYIFVILKIVGQRSIGNVSPLDFLFGVIIGDILGETLSSGELPMAGPLVSAGLVSLLHVGLSIVALRTPRFRRVIEDEPIILMQHGKILHEEMRKAKVTTESLLTDLRLNASTLDEVDYAILESNGQISFIKKSQYQSLTPSDMLQTPPPKGYPTVLIQDGHVIDANLKKVGTRSWLQEQLNKRGIRNYTEVFLLTMDEGGQIYFSKKQNVNS